MRRKPGSPKLGEHLSGILESVSEIVRILRKQTKLKEIRTSLDVRVRLGIHGVRLCYQSAMHVEGVVLKAGHPFGQPFLFVVDSV